MSDQPPGSSRPSTPSDTNERPDIALRAFLPGQWRALLFLTALMLILPVFLKNDYFVLMFNIMALNALVVLGLNLLIGSTGQVSLGHAAFYGLGAYLSAVACATWHWPLFLSLLFACVVVALIAFLLALPTLRLEGHYLVMATLGFNIIVSILFNQMESWTGGPSGFPGIPKISIGSFVLKTDLQFYYFIWPLFLVVFALTLNLTDSRLGRALQAIHEKDLTAQALGVPTYRYKVITFVLGSVYAALAGFCYAHYVTFISPKTFDIFYSVQVLVMVVVGGMGSIWGGLAGTFLLTLLPEVLHRFEDLHVLLYGLILMGVLVFCPQGLVPAILTSSIARRLRFPKHPEMETDEIRFDASLSRAAETPLPSRRIFNVNPQPAGDRPQSDVPVLSVRDVSLGFGGLQALNEVSLDVAPGQVVALIGPNGAGKTTLLNAVSGLLTPQKGEILLQGRNIVGVPPYRTAAMGIGRTFQAVQVFHRFTVIENVLLGCHVQGRCGFASAYLHSPGERREELDLWRKSHRILEAFGMAGKAHWPVERLSLLEQKIVELARALALSPSILLLDEPAGGLNPREGQALTDYISMLRRSGMGVILVEHDMNVVMRIADHIVVLQHGNRIASGPPAEVRRNPKVIAAYLGSRKR